MRLTPAEKAAGARFRLRCEEDFADLWRAAFGFYSACSPYLAWYRHSCGGQGSQALKLRQQYWTSPAYPGCPPGFFAFIWLEAVCRSCQFRVRSGSGRFVLAREHPPEKGAVVACHADRAVPGSQEDSPRAS